MKKNFFLNKTIFVFFQKKYFIIIFEIISRKKIKTNLLIIIFIKIQISKYHVQYNRKQLSMHIN